MIKSITTEEKILLEKVKARLKFCADDKECSVLNLELYKVQVGGKNTDDLRGDLKNAGVEVTSAAEPLFKYDRLGTSKEVRDIYVVIIRGCYLGVESMIDIGKLEKLAFVTGFSECPVDTVPNFLLQYPESHKCFIAIMPKILVGPQFKKFGYIFNACGCEKTPRLGAGIKFGYSIMPPSQGWMLSVNKEIFFKD